MLRGNSQVSNVTRALQPINTDVIVIGAGAAGLSAAHDLINDGWNVEVLEASSKIGGRLKKDNNLADFPIDLGGEWIHVSNTLR